MGERNHKLVETDRTEPKADRSTDTASPNEGRKRGRPRTDPSTKPTKEILGLAEIAAPKVVTVEVPKSEESTEDKPAKKGRPKGSKTKKGQAAGSNQADYSQIKLLLMTTTGIIAGKLETPIMMLSDDEAEQIAKPLANILAKNETLSTMTNEYTDYIALGIALFTIYVPKYLLYRSQHPKKSKQNKEVKTNAADNQNRQVSTSISEIRRKPTDPGHVQNDVKTFNGSIGNLLEPIVGI